MSGIKYVIQNVDTNLTRSGLKDEMDRLGRNIDTTVMVKSIFNTIQGEGPFAGYPATFVRLAGCNFGAKNIACSFCFPEKTPIMTPTGKKRIKDVKVGDELFTLDSTGDLVRTKVKKRITREVTREDLVQIKYQLPFSKKIRTLVCTSEHPFHTTKRGFIPAEDLRVGEKVYHVTSKAMQKEFMSECNPTKDPAVLKAALETRAERTEAGDYDFSRSEEAKVRYRLSKLGDKNPMKLHKNRLKNMLGHTYPKSKLEQRVEEALKSLGIQVKYTGNTGKLVVGDDDRGYRMPDFKFPKTNKVIEVYDTSFSQYKEGRRTRRNYEKPTRKFYESFGYEVLFLTQKDLAQDWVGSGNKRVEDYSRLAAKVGMFLRNGARILEVNPVQSRHFGQLARGQAQTLSVVNFSCHPHNTFIVGNLHTHNCDTDFALSKAVGHDAVYLARHLEAQGGKVQPLVVLTGGEPMMQPAVKLFIETLLEQNYKVQVETNGTHPQVLQSWITQAFSILDGDPDLTFVLSPKAVGDTDKWPALNPIFWAYDTYLKCLIEDDESSAYYQVPHWVNSLVEEFPRFNERVFVSPMAAYSKAYSGEVSSAWEPGLLNVSQTKKNYNYAGRYALEHGFRLSIQQHLFVSMA
jgi:organic radical activating enzyme